jgi:hypothetical protein
VGASLLQQRTRAGPDVFRNQREFARIFNGHFPKRHSQPASTVSPV